MTITCSFYQKLFSNFNLEQCFLFSVFLQNVKAPSQFRLHTQQFLQFHHISRLILDRWHLFFAFSISDSYTFLSLSPPKAFFHFLLWLPSSSCDCGSSSCDCDCDLSCRGQEEEQPALWAGWLWWENQVFCLEDITNKQMWILAGFFHFFFFPETHNLNISSPPALTDFRS